MKKFFLVAMGLMAGMMLLHAGTPSERKSSFTVSLGAGPMVNIYENYFSYAGSGKSLFSYQTALSVEYDFRRAIGFRVQAEYGKNVGACNVMETSAGGFYPYQFQNIAGFGDIILDMAGLASSSSAFRIKLFAGAGAAYTFNFTDSGHPWQKVKDKNASFGFRLGAIAEYSFPFGLGIFAEIYPEFFTDIYNGLEPSDEDFKRFDGYPGFPLDIRGLMMFGVSYRF